MTTPTQRSIALYTRHGYQCGIVEKFNSNIGPHGIRQDLWGAIDIIALGGPRTVGIQACSASGRAAHVTKLCAEPRLHPVFDAGWIVVVLAWTKPRSKTGPGRFWRWDHTPITVDMMTVDPVEQPALAPVLLKGP